MPVYFCIVLPGRFEYSDGGDHGSENAVDQVAAEGGHDHNGAEAYEPLREDPTLDTLERQRTLIGAADALEKRARAIHDWPVAEGTWAWVIGIATSVVAIACARLILRPFGF